jgi:uncharacterized protein (DUF3084 family)
VALADELLGAKASCCSRSMSIAAHPQRLPAYLPAASARAAKDPIYGDAIGTAKWRNFSADCMETRSPTADAWASCTVWRWQIAAEG